jgi:hypothetical protein
LDLKKKQIKIQDQELSNFVSRLQAKDNVENKLRMKLKAFTNKKAFDKEHNEECSEHIFVEYSS